MSEPAGNAPTRRAVLDLLKRNGPQTVAQLGAALSLSGVAVRRHLETLADLPDDLIGPLFANTRLLSRAIPEAMGKPGSFVALNNVVSQSVPHLHVHIVPRVPKDGLRGFFWPRSKYESEEQMREVAATVRRAVEALA